MSGICKLTSKPKAWAITNKICKQKKLGITWWSRVILFVSKEQQTTVTVGVLFFASFPYVWLCTFCLTAYFNISLIFLCSLFHPPTHSCSDTTEIEEVLGWATGFPHRSFAQSPGSHIIWLPALLPKFTILSILCYLSRCGCSARKCKLSWCW